MKYFNTQHNLNIFYKAAQCTSLFVNGYVYLQHCRFHIDTHWYLWISLLEVWLGTLTKTLILCDAIYLRILIISYEFIYKFVHY